MLYMMLRQKDDTLLDVKGNLQYLKEQCAATVVKLVWGMGFLVDIPVIMDKGVVEELNLIEWV